jgi:hypothetical protein
MVTGIRSLCTGLGPALFGALFQIAETPLSKDTPKTLARVQTQFPGAPFLVGAGCVMVALVVAVNAPGKMVCWGEAANVLTLRVGGRKAKSAPHLRSITPHHSGSRLA